MGLIETASGNSVWRGMDYYERGKVVDWHKTGDTTYDGIVSGSDSNIYIVHIRGIVGRPENLRYRAGFSNVLCQRTSPWIIGIQGLVFEDYGVANEHLYV